MRYHARNAGACGYRLNEETQGQTLWNGIAFLTIPPASAISQ